MKKLLGILKPLPLATLSLLIVTSFLRYYLYINSNQLVREFKNQNFKEIYSLDTLKISSRLNSLSSVINWVCLEGSVSNDSFYRMARGKCKTGVFQQRQIISIPEANDILIAFTIRLPKEVEYLFFLFFIFQGLLIFALIYSTKKAEEEKRLNESRINKIARQVSHDIRSPLATLNTIIATANTLPPQDSILLKSAIDRINHISNDLLSKSHNRNMHKDPLPINNPVNLVEVLVSILNEKKSEYSSNSNVRINHSLSAKEVYVKLDEYEFKRTISNLINNSIESSTSDALLIISISMNLSHDNNVHIFVEDNGKGIPPNLVSQIGKQEFTTKKSGNGLGLYHAYENIINWNGKIHISSEVNQGTTIEITLPAIHSTSKVNILLDDDELVRLTWESSAKKHGQQLIAIATNEELQILLNKIDQSSNIFIDSELGDDLAGEDIAQSLHKKGYKNLFITSGHSADRFQHLSFLKGVKDKSPPWK